MVAACLMLLAVGGRLPVYGQQPSQQSATPPALQGDAASAAAVGEGDEIAHPFFTHMGVPEGVGVFNLRIIGLLNRVDGAAEGDFGFHLETGLTKRIGLHLRNDSVRNNTHSEAMLQFLVINSQNGMSGFAPIVEFEFPTQTGVGSRIDTLVGFSSALVNERVAFNQIVHYNPRADSVEGSAAVVVRAGRRFFPVFEVLADKERGEGPMVRLLGGLKKRVSKHVVLGVALQAPVTDRRDFSVQFNVGSDISWTMKQK